MKIARKSELKGIAGLILVGLVLISMLAAATGKLEWLGLTGPQVLDRILFVSGRSGSGEVLVMGTDGSSPKQLTDGARVLSAPAISPKGNRIAFVGIYGRASQVLGVGADGGSIGQLTSATGPKGRPSYDPSGERLAYIAGGKIYVSDVDGNEPSLVLPTEAEIRASMGSATGRTELPAYSTYAWTPDGEGLAAAARGSDGNDTLIYLPELHSQAMPLTGVAQLGGENVLFILPDLSGEAKPMSLMPIPSGQRVQITGISWAADNAVMVAAIVVGKSSVLLRFDADAMTMQPVMAGKAQRFTGVSLSPDGTVTALTVESSQGKDGSGILKLSDGESTPQPLAAGHFESPRFSPDSDRILATQVDQKTSARDVVVIDASTGNLQRLTTNGHSFDGVWSPVSKR